MANRIARPRPKVTVTTTSPGILNDVTQGYQYFSQWYNSNTGELFTCVNPAVGAAVWIEGGGGGGAHVDTVNPTINDDNTLGFGAGDFWLNTTTSKVWVCISAATGAAVWKRVESNLTPSNRWMPANTTVADGHEACATAVTTTPEGNILVKVNGNQVPVGDGAKDQFCYFSSDAGATARALTAVAAGDKLYWMGSIANYELDADVDHVDFVYEV